MKKASKLTLLGLLSPALLMAQSITPWTEQNGTLGLGYPVPIPVDTPEPFDGFRTYDGLFAKHQSMALENEYITGHIVGQTHNGRDIWAYVLSDADNTTQFGIKEGAMMANGGIHSREWQSPETLTQIITDFHDHSDDQSFYQYLLENATIITIPVNNIDGFLQTQRYPSENWLGTDPTDVQGQQPSPRDGRMRRKNMPGVDEDLTTQNDHLNGVDLNRNNAPFWANSNSSSGTITSLVYHGLSTHSEPETQARLNAAALVDADQHRIYTDVHSFSLVHFSVRTFNNSTNALQARVLSDFSRHHKAFPMAKNYVDLPNTAGFGIGTTSEYFAYTYQVPSWTLEIEPSSSSTLGLDRHPELPGFGADYGGFANNGNDGFILPDSEIRRVREQLSESFMVAWYGQAGPPSITQLRVIDLATETIVYDAEWDLQADGSRELYSHIFDEILTERDYALLVRFDKPMRWRNSSGEITELQGQSTALNPVIQAEVDGNSVELNLNNPRWINEKSANWASYGFYQDDTFITEFSLDASLAAADGAELNWKIVTTDMVGQTTDGNPATAITWSGGQWINYEDSNGNPSINGGFDTSITMPVSNQSFGPEAIVPLTAHYYDPSRPGEGFNIEVLPDEFALMQWYTYDESGNPRWFLSANPYHAKNAFFAPTVSTATGGEFGPGFDPDAIELVPNGSVEMIFETIELNVGGEDILSHIGQMKYTAPDGQKFRTEISPVALVTGINSVSHADDILPSIGLTAASLVGSWFDRSRNGEGFHIQQTANGNALIQWYSYDPQGNQQWFIASDGVVTETGDNVNISFNEVYIAQGARFGADFDPADVQLTVWGTVELNLGCTSGTLAFDSNDSNYGSGLYDVIPITRPAANEFVCED